MEGTWRGETAFGFIPRQRSVALKLIPAAPRLLRRKQPSSAGFPPGFGAARGDLFQHLLGRRVEQMGPADLEGDLQAVIHVKAVTRPNAGDEGVDAGIQV